MYAQVFVLANRCFRIALANSVLCFLLVMLTGCGRTLQSYDVAELSDKRALSIIRLRVAFDGGDGSCSPDFHGSTDGKIRVLSSHSYTGIDNEWEYKIIESDPGRVYLDSMHCSQFKYFYKKSREYFLDDYYFEARPGMITYAGDVFINWRPQSFKVSDLFQAIDAEDRGKVSVTVENRVRDAAVFLANRGILNRTTRDIVPSLMQQRQRY